jgi:hypothetical protein
MQVISLYSKGDNLVKAATAGRLMGVLRVGLGTAHAIAPAPTSVPLIGSDARRPGAQAFIAAFGVRDAFLGLGVASARTDQELRCWLQRTVVIDVLDTVIAVAHLRGLPRRRRWAALTAPGVPAILGAVLLQRLGRSPRDGSAPCFCEIDFD